MKGKGKEEEVQSVRSEVAHTKGSTRLMLFNPAARSVPSWNGSLGALLEWCGSNALLCLSLLTATWYGPGRNTRSCQETER